MTSLTDVNGSRQINPNHRHRPRHEILSTMKFAILIRSPSRLDRSERIVHRLVSPVMTQISRNERANKTR